MSRRLFEQPEENTPDTSLRLAFGKALANTKNMTLANFKSWLLNSDIAFLRQSNDLSEVNASIARSNLNVPSATDMATALSARATANDGGTNPVCLSTTNSFIYTPTDVYHPVTKQYSDLKGGNILMRGLATIGNPSSGNGFIADISFATVGTTDYVICGQPIDVNGKLQDMVYGITNKTATGFRIVFRDILGDPLNNIIFPFVLISLTGAVTVNVSVHA
jgi:hypothetical protein